MPEQLVTETRDLVGVMLYGKRYAVSLVVVMKAIGPEGDQYAQIHDDVQIVIDGKPSTTDQLVDWAKGSGNAKVVVTTDKMRYGHVTKVEFTEAS